MFVICHNKKRNSALWNKVIRKRFFMSLAFIHSNTGLSLPALQGISWDLETCTFWHLWILVAGLEHRGTRLPQLWAVFLQASLRDQCSRLALIWEIQVQREERPRWAWAPPHHRKLTCPLIPWPKQTAGQPWAGYRHMSTLQQCSQEPVSWREPSPHYLGRGGGRGTLWTLKS